MEAYLCGRQVFVIMTVFLIAQVTAFPSLISLPGIGELPPWFRTVVLDTGLPGALIVVACGQLIPQLIGEEYPLALMNLPGAGQVTQLALLLYSLGIAHFALLVTFVIKRAFNLRGSSDRYSYQIRFSETKRQEMLAYARNLLDSEETNGEAGNATAVPGVLTASIQRWTGVRDSSAPNEAWSTMTTAVGSRMPSLGVAGGTLARVQQTEEVLKALDYDDKVIARMLAAAAQ